MTVVDSAQVPLWTEKPATVILRYADRSGFAPSVRTTRLRVIVSSRGPKGPPVTGSQLAGVEPVIAQSSTAARSVVLCRAAMT